MLINSHEAAIIEDIVIFFNGREAIAAVIGDILVYYDSKNLNCIGALSFLRSFHAFFGFFPSVRSPLEWGFLVTLK